MIYTKLTNYYHTKIKTKTNITATNVYFSHNQLLK